jgi:large subunit ribosomal protein L15
MELYNIQKIKGNKSKKARVGRGIGSGHGGHTSGKGHKGQKARTGNSVPTGFEGGQVPLHKKLPKIGGFKSSKRSKCAHIKLELFNRFTAGDEVTPQSLIKEKLIEKGNYFTVKVLKVGKISKKLTFKGFTFSQSAKESILKSGGNIVD